MTMNIGATPASDSTTSPIAAAIEQAGSQNFGQLTHHACHNTYGDNLLEP